MLENLEISWLVFRVARSCKCPRENHACSNTNILFRCLSRKAVVAIGANKKSELAIGDFAEQLLKLTWI